MRQLMRYRENDYAKDWELAIALAQLASRDGNQDHILRMLEATMNRILAYQANNPMHYPWEVE